MVGRTVELHDVLDRLRSPGVVTIVGVAGVGKSRLARAAADLAAPQLAPGRRWWVDLAPLDDEGVVHAVQRAVGATAIRATALDAVVAELRQGAGVLALDNCEHLSGAAAALVAALVEACPELSVLATSRSRLGVEDEYVVPLAPLPTPADGADFKALQANEAVTVFTRRATAASVSFELAPANAAAVAEVCRRLDGLPLALELAGGRVASMPPDEIARYLDDRFRLLRRPPGDHSGRHRSIEDAVRWSHELLTAEERNAFDRLSVFSGSFNLEAAAAVLQRDPLDTLELIESLVGRSMVVSLADPHESRYVLLETLRDFGRGRLRLTTDEGSAAARHRGHYLGVVETAAAALQGPAEARWVHRLHVEFPNIRTAWLSGLAEADADACLRLVVGLFDYAFFRMQREVGEWAAAALALPGATAHRLAGEAAGVAGFLAWERGSLDEATIHATRAIDNDGDWVAWDGFATICLFRGRVDEAIGAYGRAVDLATAAGNSYRTALALGQTVFAYLLAGRSEAPEVAARAQWSANEAGSPTAMAHAAWAMGVALYDADPAGALEELEHAMSYAGAVDNRLSLGAASVPAAELRDKLSRRSGGPSGDLAAAVEGLEYWLRGAPPILWTTVRRVARVLAARGELEAAAVALGAEERASLKLPVREVERDRHRGVVERVRTALGDDVYRAMTARGAALTPEQLVVELREAATAAADGDADARASRGI